MKYRDLHLHLDGSVSLDSVKKLSVIASEKLMQSDKEILEKLQVSPDCKNLNEYLSKFDFPLSFLQTEEQITFLVKNLLSELNALDYEYAEIRFAPQLHLKKGLTQERVVKAAAEGLKDGPIDAKLILCAMRGDKNERENFETLEVAKEFLGKGVCALDLAGAEALFSTGNFKELFKKARDLEVPFTIHAGEADGPKSVYTALEFGARRIGHGVRSFEDRELVKEIASQKIPLEMCPTSNMQTCVFSDIKDYPIMQYLDAGIIATVNSDNMAVSNTTVPAELGLLKKTFSLSDSDIELIQKNSVIASF
ncbi:MAG: adenosine deaminase [Treponema sp.]|nr:adenosine deaminase [Candidatus Treponema merdequi]